MSSGVYYSVVILQTPDRMSLQSVHSSSEFVQDRYTEQLEGEMNAESEIFIQFYTLKYIN